MVIYAAWNSAPVCFKCHVPVNVIYGISVIKDGFSAIFTIPAAEYFSCYLWCRKFTYGIAVNSTFAFYFIAGYGITGSTVIIECDCIIIFSPLCIKCCVTKHVINRIFRVSFSVFILPAGECISFQCR